MSETPTVSSAEVAVPEHTDSDSHKGKHFPFALTDFGNAELFADLYGKKVRYDHAQQRWIIWWNRKKNGVERWQEDTQDQILRFGAASARTRGRRAKQMCVPESHVDGQTIPDPNFLDRQREEIKHAQRSENIADVNACLKYAKALPPISDSGEGWDADDWLLGVANGVVELRTGRLRPEKQEDKITKHSPVWYDPTAKCPRWERFMQEVFQGNERIINFVRRSLGYSISGCTVEQIMFLCLGPGANGKGVLFRTVSNILGEDYATSITVKALDHKKADATDRRNMPGRRFITASETREEMILDTALIKAMTGQDPLEPKHLYKNAFVFIPKFKLWFAFNHKPQIPDDSEGMWRRPKLILFNQSFKEPGECGSNDLPKDKDLESTLLSEYPGILNWLVNGCLDYRRDGLQEPREVTAATKQYRDENNPLIEFIEDCCVVDAGASTKVGALYDAYKEWSEMNGERYPLSRNALGAHLGNMGFEADKRNGVRVRLGLKVRSSGQT